MNDLTKPSLMNRAVAALIDLVIVAILAGLPKAGLLAGLAYVGLRDGFSGGQGVGKRLVGLRVIHLKTGEPAGFRESIIRNLPFLAGRLLWGIPLIGWLGAAAIIVFEGLVVLGSAEGRRLGDELAGTRTVEAG